MLKVILFIISKKLLNIPFPLSVSFSCLPSHPLQTASKSVSWVPQMLSQSSGCTVLTSLPPASASPIFSHPATSTLSLLACFLPFPPPVTQIDLLPRYDFVTLCIGHWENSASLNFTYLANSNFFILEYPKKSTFGNITADLQREVFKYLAAVKLVVADTSFSKFCLKLQVFGNLAFLSLATNGVGCFPWGDEFTLFIFKDMSVKHQSSSQVQMVFHEKNRNAYEWFPSGHA